MTEPIISINDLSVYFNKKKALNNVTMDFYPNEITALIGPSGSGKINPAPFYQPNGRFKPRVDTYWCCFLQRSQRLQSSNRHR